MPTVSVPVLSTTTRAEVELLRCCARVVMDAASVARAQALMQHDLDWSALLRTALHHGVMPLVYRNVQALHPVTVSHSTREQLRIALHTHAGRALLLTGALHQILAVLAAHQIAALPFKGPTLAAAVYGSPVLRQFGDLDILVHPRDVLDARDILLAQGYRRYLTDAQEAAHLRAHYHLNVLRDDAQVMVELHWAFARRYWRYALHMADVQERCSTVLVAGTPVRTLAPEDLLLVLAVHGAKHFWSRLGWICDIAELLRVYPELEWGRLLGEARQLGVLRMVLLALCLAQTLLDAALPAAVVPHLEADPVVRVLAAQARGWLFREADEPRSAVEHHLFYLRLRERWQDRVPYIYYVLPRHLRQAVTPNAKDRALLPLPRPFSCLLYVVRPLRLMGTYGWRAWQTLWQKE